jgi:hypothetical protein
MTMILKPCSKTWPIQLSWSIAGNTLPSVETYWMSISDFRFTFPGRDVPRDLALYDRQLLVAYDESKLILRFDVVRRDAGVCRLFDDVTEMISRHTPSLKRVEPPAGRVMSLPRDGSASVGAAE